MLRILLFFSFFSLNLGSVFSQYISFTNGVQNTSFVSTIPNRTTENGYNEFYNVTYNFTGATIAKQIVEGDKYDFLHIDGFLLMTQVGAPALPAKTDIIAMPKGTNGHIEIIESQYFEYPGFMIHPALKPAEDTEGAEEPKFEKDETIYNSNKFFPAKTVEIANIGLSRGTPLAYVQIRPVKFNPITGMIRVYTKISYKIVFDGGKSFDYIAKENTINYTNLLKLNVLNSESIPNGIDILNNRNEIDSRTEAKNYIIITHSEYLNEANKIANWKRQLGLTVEVVSQSSWTASQVKTAIHDRYDNWTPKPDYFLIIGDHDGSFAVPGEIHQDPNYGDDFATDLYFACMDGSSDWHPDMAHGRISVSSSIEAQIVIDKVIKYEKTPPSSATYYGNMLSCAQYQDDDNNGYADRRFCHTSEDIRDYMQNSHGFTSERVYYTSTSASKSSLRYNNGDYSDGQLLPAELRDNSFDWDGGATDITNSINAGKFLVFHRDHGYVGGSGWAHPYYTTSSMDNLSNGDELPVIFSINCHTGEYQLSNCFAEKFLRMQNKGAVGVIAAAYYSYSGYNDALAEGMIDAIWADPGLYPDFGTGGTGDNYSIGAGNEIYTMGDVVNQGLYAMEQNWNGSSTGNKYEYELFHWFGDPAMKIWTSNPNNNVISATHSSTIDCDGNTFSVTNSTNGAKATLVYNEKLIGQTILDASGNGSISYSISEPGTEVLLTISKHNNYTYVDTLNLTGSCDYPPSINTNSTTGVTETTAMANGEIIDDFGNAITESGFVYSLNPNPEINGTGVTKILTDPLIASGSYAIDISGLSHSTTYYIRAYAINSSGIGYGDDDIFTTLSPCSSCASDGNMGYQTSTTNVSINTINNTTGKSAAYNDYTNISTELELGKSYNLSVRVNTDGNFVLHTIVWIDWNKDCDFDDANEEFDMGTAENVTDGLTDQSPKLITIPLDAVLDSLVMRVSTKYLSDPESCEEGYDGEVEDYHLVIIEGSSDWKGNTSDWFSTSNWGNGIIPKLTSDVIIPTTPIGGNFPVITVGTNAKCNSLTLESGASLTINGDLKVESECNFSSSAQLILNGNMDIK